MSNEREREREGGGRKDGFVLFIYLRAYKPFIGYLMSKFDMNNFHTVIWLQVFLSNTNNSYTFV